MKSLRIALVEGHSWPQEASIDAHIYGCRRYNYLIGPSKLSARVDILDAWKISPGSYNAYIVADELAGTRLPFYIPYQQRIALLKESPIHLGKISTSEIASRFHKIFTHQSSKVQKGKPFVFLPYSANFLGIKRNNISETLVTPNKKRLCSFIGNLSHSDSIEGYRIRNQVFGIVQSDTRIHCFGKDINPIDDKGDALYPYAFSIAVENAREDYYFSEKLVDCILTGTIPIYWGCPSIGDIFNPRGILSFESIDEFKAILNLPLLAPFLVETTITPFLPCSP